MYVCMYVCTRYVMYVWVCVRARARAVGIACVYACYVRTHVCVVYTVSTVFWRSESIYSSCSWQT